jgi:Phospholipase_D-nuclease N-terminal
MRTNIDLATLPPGALIGLGAVLVVEIVLDVAALINLYRRPVAAVTFGNKWIWVAIIVLINLVGAILYFAIGRKPIQTDQAAGSPRRSSADIADALYGSDDEPKQQ